jgi:hypothetical protein
MAIDASDQIYVLNYQSTLYKVDASGTKTSLATGLAASINIACDTSGNVYVPVNNIIADGQPYTGILKITPAGVSSTFYMSSELLGISGIAIDSLNNVYFMGTNVIYKVTQDGIRTTYAGNGTQGYVDGPAASAEFNFGYGVLTIDGSGNLYVSELNCVIRKIDTAGNVTTLAGNGIQGYVDGSGVNAEFYGQEAIVADALGNVYVNEDLSTTSVLRKITE